MSREDDRWRLPALARFGAQLRDAERADRGTAARRPSRRRLLSLRAAALLVALALIAALVDVVTPAGALSPINHAPAAAKQSGSVRFSSALAVAVNGRPLTHLTERGELDFVTGDYDTTLNVGGGSAGQERRRVGSVFYVAHLGRGARAQSARWRAIHVAGRAVDALSDTLIDPQVVFRVLAQARSPVTVVGHEELAGTRTTHYQLSTTLAAFLAAEQSSLAQLPPDNGAGATLNVWLDTRGRPTRVEANFSAISGVGKATMTTVVDFTGYGVPIAVRAPSSAALSPRSNTSPVGPLEGDPIQVLERLLFLRH